MRTPYQLIAFALAGSLTLTACLGSGQDRVLGIDATGTVQGLVYFDANGTREPEDTDPPLANIGLRLVAGGSRDTVARSNTDADGRFRLPRVPVGSYEVVVDPASVVDSVQVVKIVNGEFTLQPDDSVSIVVTVSFPKVTIELARSLPVGDRVFIEGVALNAWETFGDLTVHVADLTGALRATRVRPTSLIPGDGIRFQGIIGTQAGQPTLEDVIPLVIAVAGLPPAQRLNTATAANADTGRLDAGLVEIAVATIVSTVTVAGDIILTVNDGSGNLEVVLDKDVRLTDTAPFISGAVIDAVGLLVPDGFGAWRLKPRSDDDLKLR